MREAMFRAVSSEKAIPTRSVSSARFSEIRSAVAVSWEMSGRA
jgi:hypothetical protein